jgi:hypothetical protein
MDGVPRLSATPKQVIQKIYIKMDGVPRLSAPPLGKAGKISQVFYVS